ncbi:hypothetical protein GWI33_011986 [Rhynchophorus ferrugineus]|uniref:Uncharacterized protein n=1 Tax=Rhynchophorus ferrugineus TaxID=354439 RepID=A0A834MLX6_RHYFE|nr:hypothetical protein GWI33_011986 [Rhynchophorus ferrugineus]
MFPSSFIKEYFVTLELQLIFLKIIICVRSLENEFSLKFATEIFPCLALSGGRTRSALYGLNSAVKLAATSRLIYCLQMIPPIYVGNLQINWRPPNTEWLHKQIAFGSTRLNTVGLGP